jgi:hypothetical protein
LIDGSVAGDALSLIPPRVVTRAEPRRLIQIATMISYTGGFMEAVDEIQALEKAGLHTAWVPEAYGFDAPSLMGYLAAKTSSVRIASGILPIYTRTPTLLAMTAAGVTSLNVSLVGHTVEDRLNTLDQLNELIAGG